MERKELHLVYNEKTGSDMYDVAEADAVMDAMEARIKELQVDNELLNDRVAELTIGYNDTLKDTVSLSDIIEEKDNRIKELESREESLNSACRCLNNRIKELEAENFKLKIKLGNKVVPSILNAKNEECLMERIEETK